MKVANIKAEVGCRLRALREKKGWSQEELGFRANRHRNYVGSIERGERNVGVEKFAKLAKALKIRPRDLLPQSLIPFEPPGLLALVDSLK